MQPDTLHYELSHASEDNLARLLADAEKHGNAAFAEEIKQAIELKEMGYGCGK